MDIIIGKQGNQPFPLTESSISRHHAILHVDDKTGKVYLRDNNSTNGTYILNNNNFVRILKEIPVTLNTLVRVGEKHTFYIKDVLKPIDGGDKKGPGGKEESVDISNLKGIYEAYNKNKMNLELKQSNIMMIRMASMSLGGFIGLVLSMVLPNDFAGDENISTIIKASGTVLAIAIAWVVVDIMSKSLIKRKDQNERFFKRKYCCPKCGYHFGIKLYENILAEGKCPNSSCKCKFTGK